MQFRQSNAFVIYDHIRKPSVKLRTFPKGLFGVLITTAFVFLLNMDWNSSGSSFQAPLELCP